MVSKHAAQHVLFESSPSLPTMPVPQAVCACKLTAQLMPVSLIVLQKRCHPHKQCCSCAWLLDSLLLHYCVQSPAYWLLHINNFPAARSVTCIASMQAVSLELASLWNRAKELLDVADTSALSQAVGTEHSRVQLQRAGVTEDGVPVRRHVLVTAPASGAKQRMPVSVACVKVVMSRHSQQLDRGRPALDRPALLACAATACVSMWRPHTAPNVSCAAA